jgi:hypothetical protein
LAWKEEQQKLFNNLKNRLISVPILAQFDLDHNVIVETEPSDYVSARVLSQYDDKGILYPVTFF